MLLVREIWPVGAWGSRWLGTTFPAIFLAYFLADSQPPIGHGQEQEQLSKQRLGHLDNLARASELVCRRMSQREREREQLVRE